MNVSLNVPMVPGLAVLAPEYDGYILDVWGVMHQGGPAYPEALACVRRLREAGKRVAFVSNAPRLSAQVERVLNGKGVDAALYDAVVASGDAARRALADRAHPPFDGLGTRYHLLGPPGSDDVLDGLGFTAAGIDRVDFLLGIGLDAGRETVEDHEPMLQSAAARDLPMICVNPDLLVIRLGVQEPCAGALAARYEAIGGRVRYYGKPYGRLRAGAGCPRPPTCARARGRRRPRHRHRRGERRRPRFAPDHGRPSRRRSRPRPGAAPSAHDLDEACRAAGARPNAALATFIW